VPALFAALRGRAVSGTLDDVSVSNRGNKTLKERSAFWRSQGQLRLTIKFERHLCRSLRRFADQTVRGIHAAGPLRDTREALRAADGRCVGCRCQEARRRVHSKCQRELPSSQAGRAVSGCQ
jgi:hypothetical protein